MWLSIILNVSSHSSADLNTHLKLEEKHVRTLAFVHEKKKQKCKFSLHLMPIGETLETLKLSDL